MSNQLVPTSLFLKIRISQSPSRNRAHAEQVWHALGLEKIVLGTVLKFVIRELKYKGAD